MMSRQYNWIYSHNCRPHMLGRSTEKDPCAENLDEFMRIIRDRRIVTDRKYLDLAAELRRMVLRDYSPDLGLATVTSVSRMIFDGFFDRFQKLKIVASHGGGTLPYLIGRMDQCYEHIPACRTKTQEKPSLHARRIYADSVVFTDEALAMAVNVFGSGNVLYGSDYPHTIGDPIGCLARVDRLPEGVRERVRGSNSERIFDFK